MLNQTQKLLTQLTTTSWLVLFALQGLAADLRITDPDPDLFFDDTTTVGDDWRVIGRDSNFGIYDDIDNHYVMYVQPTNGTSALTAWSIYIEADGDMRWGDARLFLDRSVERLGLGTTTPARHFHMRDGDTPRVRLDQDGTSGFAPHTWDVAGNETNFFVSDVTNGSNLVFRIIAGAPGNSVYVKQDGNVGLRTTNPTAALHVRRTDGTAAVLVDEASTTAAARDLFVLRNKGNTKFRIEETNSGNTWAFTNSGDEFRVSLQGSGVVEFRVDNNGDAFLDSGTLTENSDVHAKQAIVAIDPGAVLDKVVALPVSQWQYKDTPGINHIGPMAQDFHAAFGLGATDTGISTLDTSGVALAAIQALNARLEQRNAELEARNAALEERLARIEAALGLGGTQVAVAP